MSKKLVSLALVLMLLVSGVVYAALPSKIVTDMVQVSTDSGVAIEMTVTPAAQELFDKINTFLDAGYPVIDYFPVDAQQAIQQLVGNATVEINEFVPLAFSNYVGGDVTVAFTFATNYQPGQMIVAAVAVQTEIGVQWHILPAQVTADGKVEITFTAEIAELIAKGDAALAILSAK